jgi:Ran GTPase-activating protein 1
MFYKANPAEESKDRIWDEESQITKVLEELDLNKEKLTAVQFSSNSIGKIPAKKISEKLKEAKNLQYVNISDIFVSRKLNEIPEALNDLVMSFIDKNIRIVNFSHNALGPIGVEQISNFLSTTKNLMELYIENCGLGPEGAELLSKSLLDNKNKLPLERLIINSNRLEDKGAKSISE